MLFPSRGWRYYVAFIESRTPKAAVFTSPPLLGVKRYNISEPCTTKNDSNARALKRHRILLGDAPASSPHPSLSRTFTSVPLKLSTPPPSSPSPSTNSKHLLSPAPSHPPSSVPPPAKHPKAKKKRTSKNSKAAGRPPKAAKIPTSKHSKGKKGLQSSGWVMSTFIEYNKLRTFPYKNLTKADQHVVERFFNSEPFHAHGWDMFVSLVPLA